MKPNDVFEAIDSAASILPRIGNRKNIFKELKELYERKSMNGFYALCVTQVEGIFTEILEIADPTNSYATKALPDKVRGVMDLTDWHQRTLDYFMYEVPKKRNSFLHTGRGLPEDSDELEYECLDLLHDLSFVISLFHGLDDPFVLLHILVSRDARQDVEELKDLADLFELSSKLKHRMRQKPKNMNISDEEHLSERLKEYMQKHFVDDGWLSRTVHAIASQFDAEADRITTEFLDYSRTRYGRDVDLRQNDRNIGEREARLVEVFEEFAGGNHVGDNLCLLGRVLRCVREHEWCVEESERKTVKDVLDARRKFVQNVQRLGGNYVWGCVHGE